MPFHAAGSNQLDPQSDRGNLAETGLSIRIFVMTHQDYVVRANAFSSLAQVAVFQCVIFSTVNIN